LEIAELARSLAQESTQRALIHREIEIAREVQERLFPQSIPTIAGGAVIGLLPHTTYEEEALTLNTGDLLVLYTDGFSEAMTSDDEEWGEERMLAAVEAVRSKAAVEVISGLFEAADRFTQGAPQQDDMTLLALKINAA
jgi:serine phosphatase RsbU (regulator of sigma subunit)